MKTSTLFIVGIFILLPTLILAQHHNRCATDEFTKAFIESPEYPRLKEQLEMAPKWKNAANIVSRSAFVPDTIAVVVHVLWSTANQNIPDSVIIRQIAILNEDFPRLNSDSVNTPSAFVPNAGRANYRFQLARRDNLGAVTNGIVHWQTSHGPFSSLFDLIQTSAGGHNSWGGSYLNIYCCDIDPSTGAAGIAFFGGNFCMIDFQYFGLNNLSSLGRVATHEVGHCFGLKHIWGSEPQQGPFDCNDDDGVADTPLQYEPGSFCGTFPKLDSCTNAGNGIMYMDYMDYTFGSCQNMFTNGQVLKMDTVITNSHPNIINSTGLIPVPPFDAGCPDILEPSGSACGAINPVVVIRNWGSLPLTSLTIYYKVDNNPVDSAAWTGNLSNYETDTVSLSTLNVLAGNHTFTVYTDSPNGNLDPEPLNDTSYSAFTSGNALTIPIVEGFENSFPPYGWAFSSPDTAFGFRLETSVAFSGNNSMEFFGQLNSTYTGEITASLQTSFLNLIDADISFDYAHTYENCCGDLDTLDIFVSNDCGQNYTLVSSQYGDSIRTAPVITLNVPSFVPLISEWRNRTVDLSAFAGSQDVTIKFRLVNMWGLNFYIDNVNIAGVSVGVDELNQKNFSLYPNPNSGRFFIDGGNEKYFVEVLKPDGRLVYRNNFLKGRNEINLNSGRGIYFIRMSNTTSTRTYKIIVD